MRTDEEAQRGRGHSPSPQMAKDFSYLSAGGGWAELRTTADSDSLAGWFFLWNLAGLNPAPKRCAGAPAEIRMERLKTTAPRSLSVPPPTPPPHTACRPRWPNKGGGSSSASWKSIKARAASEHLARGCCFTLSGSFSSYANSRGRAAPEAPRSRSGLLPQRSPWAACRLLRCWGTRAAKVAQRQLAAITSAAAGLKAAACENPAFVRSLLRCFAARLQIPRVHLAIGWRGRRNVNSQAANERRAEPLKV